MNKSMHNGIFENNINKISYFKAIVFLYCFNLIFLFSISKVNGQYSNNYVRSWIATAPESNSSNLIYRQLSDVKETSQYFDGLGRPIQTVIKAGSLETLTGLNSDLVSMIGYDDYGREFAKYLTYASGSVTGFYKTDAMNAQPNYYNSNYSPIVGQGELGKNAHTQISFEKSPLYRPILSMAPGNSWVGSTRGVASSYLLNNSTDDVKKFGVTISESVGVLSSYIMLGTYSNGSLFKTIIVDESNNQVIEFKDFDGRVILKKVANGSNDSGNGSGYTGWICTYYIYDDLGALRCVIQPSGIEAMVSNGWSFTNSILSEQCFRYEYDYRNRMILKKVPGASEVYMVYDCYDRLVMTQDGNMRNNSSWMVTVYDYLNRPIQTGILSDGSSFSTNISGAYSSNNYPTVSSNFQLLSITHYDDYSGLPSGLYAGLSSNGNWGNHISATNNSSFPYPQYPLKNNAYGIKGLVTWSQMRVLDGSPSTFSYSANIYDDNGRLIQNQLINHTGGIDVTTTQYSWGGQPLTVVQSEQKGGLNGQSTVLISRMTYDALNRLVNTSKQLKNSLVNNNAETGVINVSSMQYDALGQLKVKNLGNTRSGSNYTGSPLDIQTYEYNIRGWLLGINRNFITTQPSSNNSNILGESFTTPPSYTAGNYFGFELAYDNNGVLGNYNHLYNGNISGMTWKSIHDEQVRKYDFTYDEANRLKTADFNQFTSGYFNKNAGVNYSVNNLNYDKNGNILSMNQMGLRTLTATNSALVDQLSYAYQSGSNKLSKVTDAALANGNVLGDFQDGTNDGDDYTYDANGNLISDANKGISSIQYNYLNLPQTISMTGKGTISFTYDAAGNKLQKLVVDNTNGTTTTTQYLGGLIYQNDVLQYIAQEEGRIRINANNNGFIFDYFLKDHLGNTRMTITDDNNAASPVIDATSYYPFGLTMSSISSKAARKLENKYKFNKGSELQQQEFSDCSGLELYDTHFRELDVQLGRWIQLDPQPNFNESLYGSMKNNPILYNDPLGDTVIIKNGIASGDNVNVSLVSIVDRGKLSRGTQAIVLHRTEGGNAEGAISAWKEEKGAAGAHVVVDKDGKITQVVNFDNKANQVGKTKYPSYPNNSNSVGIEVVGRYSEKTKTWEPLTPQQVTSTADLVNGIMKAYGLTLKNIYEHDIISWKTNGEGTVVRKAIQDKLDNSTSKH